MKGKHVLQVGGGEQYIPVFHQRDDKVVGTQYTALVYNLNAATSVSIPAADRPPTCGSGVTANCLASSAVSEWNNLFAGSLGIVDSAGTIVTATRRSIRSRPERRFGDMSVGTTSICMSTTIGGSPER